MRYCGRTLQALRDALNALKSQVTTKMGSPCTLQLATAHRTSASCNRTSHSAYVATETELVVAKIDGLLPPNFL